MCPPNLVWFDQVQVYVHNPFYSYVCAFGSLCLGPACPPCPSLSLLPTRLHDAHKGAQQRLQHVWAEPWSLKANGADGAPCPPPRDPDMSGCCVSRARFTARNKLHRELLHVHITLQSCRVGKQQRSCARSGIRTCPGSCTMCPCALEGYNTNTGFSQNEMPKGTS